MQPFYFTPGREEFIQLASTGNLVPLRCEVLADLETPVSAFLKLQQNGENAFLLESVEGGEALVDPCYAHRLRCARARRDPVVLPHATSVKHCR